MDEVNEAVRLLRLSIPVSDIEKQKAVDVLCKEIERLREIEESYNDLMSAGRDHL
jgi:hypothetical protein